MITVEYPPGSSDPVHRHNAHAFVCVLEGSIVMRVRGRKEMTLTPGQTFYGHTASWHWSQHSSTRFVSNFFLLNQSVRWIRTFEPGT
jgi:quercetin dioxygenase-like cupin family protein